ncbi:hypothetical protein SEA_SIXAMA_200 [Gordonia phage Sixama]|uniref:Uncharacterized protein n=1 Tax=Gordonia phage Sixama TaxID=2653271 RepID=A0A5Q2F0A1_9CAUD|nr:hypothetical protein PP302_gp003 [Gordonia phage Sixama]YP_010648880.1 hypothetical protein PP302_gp129 [Gordonia phage Sixama]QGF20182.1 hypothetical protein SEA_SIXAMA_3 [Gordonia phage Sixama]QGF20350.1 hypothetical protein SEA_SIXAMA_200 [Gordonia phage Sixama]
MARWQHKTYTVEQAKQKSLELASEAMAQAMHGGKCPPLMMCTYCPIKIEVASDGKPDRFALVIKTADDPAAITKLAGHIYRKHLKVKDAGLSSLG